MRIAETGRSRDSRFERPAASTRRVTRGSLFVRRGANQMTVRFTLRVDNVVLVSIDSLRADHVGAYGYDAPTTPTIDRLASTGVTFTRAYSTTSWTLPSHASLFTGLDDYAHGLVKYRAQLPNAVQTLAEALSADGVHTVGFFSGPYLHPAFGLARGFLEYIDCTGYGAGASDDAAAEILGSRLGEAQIEKLRIAQEQMEREGEFGPMAFLASHHDVTNPILLQRVEEWLASGRMGRRNFIFLHMWDVHFDYIPPKAYLDRFDPGYAGSLTAPFYGKLEPGLDARDLQHILARYDAEIRYTDDTLARILEMLGREGLLDRAAVIVLADHGEEFLEHGGYGHRRTLFEEVLRIPLVVNIPGAKLPSARVDEVVSIIDVHPTVCELMQIACPSAGASQSLVPFLVGGARTETRGDALGELLEKDLEVLVRRHDKTQRRGGKTTYFDGASLARERGGLRIEENQLARYSGDVQEAVRRLEERARGAERAGGAFDLDSPSAPEVPEQTRKHLEALGYLE
jgi:arylsulfatase A-like enzyme